MKSVRVPAYAKVNLCLNILGRRPDGYHELRTIFQTISLHDTLDLALLGRGEGNAIHFRLLGNLALASEAPQKNLVYRALETLRREMGWRAGISATLTKRIPAGRGLGGGSSDAAATLIGLTQLAGERVDLACLSELAAGLGADVPFFLHGGRALGIGRGDEIYPLPDVARQTVLVVSPHEIAVPTPDAYRWLAAAKLTNGASPSKLLRFCALCWSPQANSLSNDFEGAVFRRHPRLGRIKRELLKQGAAEAALAGSGSAVFGLFQDPAHARRAARAFPEDQVFVCSSLSRAAYRRKLGSPAVS